MKWRANTHLRAGLLPPKVLLIEPLPGFCALPAFLVIKVTPPFSPSAGTIPTACSYQYKIHNPSIFTRCFDGAAYLLVDESSIL